MQGVGWAGCRVQGACGQPGTAAHIPGVYLMKAVASAHQAHAGMGGCHHVHVPPAVAGRVRECMEQGHDDQHVYAGGGASA